MFGVTDYGAFVVAVIVFLAIPGPGNLALITSTGKGGLVGGLAATLGVIAGDQLLIAVARRLQAAVRETDTVARMGGDEFTVILAELPSSSHLEGILQKMLRALGGVFQLGTEQVFVSASIGIGLYPIDGREADELLRNADTAMYRAKESGRNAYQFYLPQMNERALARMRTEALLRGALEHFGLQTLTGGG